MTTDPEAEPAARSIASGASRDIECLSAEIVAAFHSSAMRHGFGNQATYCGASLTHSLAISVATDACVRGTISHLRWQFGHASGPFR